MSIFTVPQMLAERKICQRMNCSCMTSILFPDLVHEVLTETQVWEQRGKKIKMCYNENSVRKSPSFVC